MARPRYPAHQGPLPPPLPHETRPVGQLIAESIRLYGSRFWASLALGLPVAVLDELAFRRSTAVETLLLWACAPLLTAGYVAACALVAGIRLVPRSALVAFAVGLVVFIPVPIFVRVFVLPAFAWLALFGLAVPAAVIERTGFGESIVRGVRLARADYVHALGSLAAVGLVYGVSRIALFVLLGSQADATQRIAGFLADLVLSPLLFLAPAFLYFDQAARYARPSASHSRRKPSKSRR